MVPRWRATVDGAVSSGLDPPGAGGPAELYRLPPPLTAAAPPADVLEWAQDRDHSRLVAGFMAPMPDMFL